MGILVADSMSQLLMPSIMGILKMGRNSRPGTLHTVHCCKNSIHRCITLRCTCHICSSLGKNDLGFRHSYPLNCLGCCCCHYQGLGICISNIFRSKDHHTSCNKFHIFTCIQHLRQIINCSIRIGAAHTLDKCRNNVIMVISILIIAHHTLLDTLRSHIQSNMDLAV